MLNIDERVAATIQNPATDKKVLFNDAADGLLKTKDSAGVVQTLATTEGLAAAALATEPKVYVALLSQTGTSAPVATVLENTLGGVPVWTYSGVGTYDVTLASAFPTSKTNIETTLINWLDSAIDNEDMFVKITKNSQSAYTIISYVNTSNTNGILNKFYFKIEVYP